MSRPVLLLPAGLALLGLSTLAIAMPLFETLGRGATFFIAHQAQAVDIFAFVAGVYLTPPILMLLLVAGLRLASAGLALAGMSLLAGILVVAWLLGLLAGLPPVAAIALALAGGLATGIGYYRSEKPQSFLQFTGLLSPLAVVSFLWLSPVSKLVSPALGMKPDHVAGTDTPVVMLVLDELSQAAISAPGGAIDAGRLPNTGRLAAMSTWYSNTISVSVQTERAIASMLSGRRPGRETAPIYTQFPLNLFTLLAPSHELQAIETVSRMCPENLCKSVTRADTRAFDRAAMYSDLRIIWWHSVLPKVLAKRWLPAVSSSWRDFGQPGTEPGGGEKRSDSHWFAAMVADMAARNKERFQRFLHGVGNSTRTSFHYLHMALPHVPWVYLPDGRVYNGSFTPGQSALSYDWLDNQFLVDQGALRYSLQLEYVDKLLGELLDVLEKSPRFEETLLIVVSDHGLAFAPGELRRRPVSSTLADVARVPLFIRYPGQVGGVRDDRPVETIDILPTVADVLGIPLAETVDGQSLVAENAAPRQRSVWEGRETIADVEAEQDMAMAIARIQRVVDAGRSSLDTLAQGPGGAYYGQAAPAPAPSATSPYLRLERGEWYRQIEPDSAFIPARLTGWLREAAPGTALAVAVNGVVAGSGESFGETGEVSIMLDPGQFRPGHNSITAFLVTDDGLAAIPVDSGDGDWELSRDENGFLSRVRRGNRRWSPAGNALGHAALSRGSTALGSIRGWAFERDIATAAGQLLLLDGDRALASGFRPFLNPVHAREQGLDEELPYWYYLEIGPATMARGEQLSVLALFENGEFLELKLADSVAVKLDMATHNK